MWTVLSSTSIVYTAYLYISEEYQLLVSLLVCLKLTLAVSLGLLFNNVLIKEPVTQNPFKTVYGVIKYAIKHKSPRQRSAFTYTGEDELPSRIDFGKSKYGGPFTTEQVEDVKTFFRLLLVAVVVCSFLGMTIEGRFIHNVRNIFLSALAHRPVNALNILYTLVLVPLYEITVHPLFHSYLPTLKSHVKFFLGFIVRLLKYTMDLALITYARQQYAHRYHITPSSNTTLTCIFYKAHDGQQFLSKTLDHRWIILLEALVVVSELLAIIGALEFYCAQVPYSMRGLVTGIVHGLLAFFMMIPQGVQLPFKSESLDWGTGILSCGFWYLLTILIYLVIVMAATVVVMRWYKKRKREDVLPNEQIFAERYYSKTA